MAQNKGYMAIENQNESDYFYLLFVRSPDMLFLQGSEAIFKVALSLLGSHKPLIMQQNSLEAIVDFIKSTLPKLGLVQMEKTINQVLTTFSSNTGKWDLDEA